MCVAIYKPANCSIRTAHFLESFRCNPHGAGFSLALGGGKMLTRKGFFKVEDFLAAWDEQETHATPALIHFRVATHGSQKEENCHPFAFVAKDGQEMSAIHNGVLGEFGRRSRASLDDKSDTRLFVEKVLAPVALQDADLFFHVPAAKTFLELGIGQWNKVAILRADGAVQILNESQGEWVQEDGGKVWYSNNSYKTSKDQEGYFRGRRRLGPDDPGPVESGATGGVGQMGSGPQLLLPAAGPANTIDPRLFQDCWVSGGMACREGVPYDPQLGASWREGFMDALQGLFDDPIFYEGYSDAVFEFPMRDLKQETGVQQSASKKYDAGFRWGQYELAQLPSAQARQELAEEVLEQLGSDEGIGADGHLKSIFGDTE